MLFGEESFTCVFGETALTASSPASFLQQAVEFANEQMWGTLSAALSVPPDFHKSTAEQLDRAVDALRYGTVGINLWPGVAFALMSTPWGAYPGATLDDIQSGRGSVHNTYLLARPTKTVVRSPPTFMPKPMWFSTHRRPESLARSLIRLYLRPSPVRLLPVLTHAILG